MTHELTERVLAAVDSREPGAFAEFLAEDARLVFGNAEPLVGREAIIAGVQGFLSTLNGLRHHILNQWYVDADTVAEAEVTYSRLDGKSVSIPVESIWHTRADGLIASYRGFFDAVPVYAP